MPSAPVVGAPLLLLPLPLLPTVLCSNASRSPGRKAGRAGTLVCVSMGDDIGASRGLSSGLALLPVGIHAGRLRGSIGGG